MIRNFDLTLTWTLKNRAWIDRCFHSLAGPMWRRESTAEADHLFRFVHDRTHSDPLFRRLPPGTEIRVAASAPNDLVVTVSHLRQDVHEILGAYEVANRTGASHAPYAATGTAGSGCRHAFLARRFAHLTIPRVEPLADNDVVRPELDRLRTVQEEQYERRGFVTAGEHVVFLQAGSDDVFPVDGRHFARDPLPGPRGAPGHAVAPARRTTARVPLKPLVSRLLEARPAWLTPELATSAAQLRLFVNIMQDMGSAATRVHLGDPGPGSVALPVYVPMTDAADGELAARLQWVTWFADTAEVRVRRRCGTCRRASTAACRVTRSTARTRPVLSVAGATSAAAPGTEVEPRPSRLWSCGRCPGARVEEETIFVCPACRGPVSPLDALHGCPTCGYTPG